MVQCCSIGTMRTTLFHSSIGVRIDSPMFEKKVLKILNEQVVDSVMFGSSEHIYHMVHIVPFFGRSKC